MLTKTIIKTFYTVFFAASLTRMYDIHLTSHYGNNICTDAIHVLPISFKT